MSGAGKTQTINCLEDLGYYCVDNLPPSLLIKFIELSIQAETRIVKVAMVIDVRGGEFFHDLSRSLG
ncbi:MAG: RNase adapter protein RapZ, partial [Firmicutes bacterium]|nr:RNase adapter protein RapZ [Bacillota bacterium]